MDTTSIINASIGGVLIGIATGVFLVLNGRIAGISGVLGGLLVPRGGDTSWRAAFIGGLLAGGLGLVFLYPAAFPEVMATSKARLIGAGLLVGFGTRLGGGCTSGHGVCGVSRFSPRSLVATGTFMATGAITVVILSRVVGN